MEPEPIPAPAPHAAWRPGKPLSVAAIVIAAVLVAAGVAIAGIAKVRDAASQTKSKQHLQQLGLGLQNFDSAQSALPPHVIYGEDGQKLANWRFSILPYIDQDCYFNTTPGGYHRQQPWDTEHNLAAISKMDKVYAAPGIDSTTGLTHYHAFDGENTPLANDRDDPVRWRYRSKWSVASLSATQRGTSNILFVVEAGPPAIWTRPDGLPYAGDRPLLPLEPLHLSGIPVLKCDGSVVVVRPGNADAVWRAYIDPASSSNLKFDD